MAPNNAARVWRRRTATALTWIGRASEVVVASPNYTARSTGRRSARPDS